MADDGIKIKVGALVLVAIALLIGFVALLGTFSVGDRITLYVELSDSGGLLAGAPVRIAGVRAGRVDAVEFFPDATTARTDGPRPVHVRLTAEVDAEMFPAVRQDSEFYVTSQGVLGEKYLEIRPGSPAAAPLQAAAAVRGRDPARIDLIFARAESILAQIELALSGGGQLGVGALVDNITRLSGRANAYLDRHDEALEQATRDLVATGADLRAITAALRAGIGSGEEVAATMRDLTAIARILAREAGPLARVGRDALQNLQTASAEVNRLIEIVRPPLEAVLADLPAITRSGREALRDTAAITAAITAGQGVIGQVIVDDEIYADLKELLRDIKRNPWKLVWRE
ncbi:MAG: MCE family protein [Myxococcales bacterium]|nr:MCE family protein [Myxococcales bacterium]MCB9552810.1 MCE family protein [Myxococcales bacterium]